MSDRESTQTKFQALKAAVRETGGLAVAFSGGVDSTFLAAVAASELGERALAVTALSPTYARHEQREAEELAARIGIRHVQVASDELAIAGFAENPPDRCYFCKRELFATVGRIAREHGLETIADGTNADDLADHRPGLRAAREAGVRMFLLEAGLTKEEVRALSREMELPTADKPAQACLASRFPYGTRITAAKLAAVDAVERAVRAHGIRQVRVRHHGDTARIEVPPEALAALCAEPARGAVVQAAKAAGFAYVAADLQGYRTGSLNELLHTGHPPHAQ